MHPDRRLRLSKFLSLILRHRPEQVGLTLDPQGRVAVEDLVGALKANGWEDLLASEIEEVVRLDARRFALQDGMIRARYGHSITLQQPGPMARPPEWLYNAVADEEAGAVSERGLRPGQRAGHTINVCPSTTRRSVSIWSRTSPRSSSTCHPRQ
jgi:putative RNA 2'-phosphotransferase